MAQWTGICKSFYTGLLKSAGGIVVDLTKNTYVWLENWPQKCTNANFHQFWDKFPFKKMAWIITFWENFFIVWEYIKSWGDFVHLQVE